MAPTTPRLLSPYVPSVPDRPIRPEPAPEGTTAKEAIRRTKEAIRRTASAVDESVLGVANAGSRFVANSPWLRGAFPAVGAFGLVQGAASPFRSVERPDKPASPQASPAVPTAVGGGGGISSVTIKEGRPVDETYLASRQQAGQRYLDERERTVEMQRDVNAREDDLLRSYAADAKAMKQQYQGVSGEMMADYKAVAADLKRARDELRGMKVDTSRFWNSMPRSQQVLVAIGQMLGEGASAASGGKVVNHVGRWLGVASQQDIENQREAIKRKMDEVEMTAKERDSLWAKWNVAEQQIRDAARDAAKLELARVAIATKDIDLKNDLSKAILSIGMENATAEHGEFVASKPQVVRHYSSGGGGGKGKSGKEEAALGRVPVVTQTRVMEAINAVRGIDELKQWMIAKRPLHLPYRLSGEDSRLFMQKQRPAVEAFIKSQSGSVVPLKERQIFENMFIQGQDLLGGLTGGERNLKEQLNKLQGFRRTALNTIRTYGPAYPALMEAATKTAPEYVREAMADAPEPVK